MTKNGSLITPDLFSFFTPTTDADKQGSHDIENVLKANPSQYWRTRNNVKSATITIDISQREYIDSIAICLHNLSLSSSVKIQAYDGATLKYEEQKAGLVPPHGYGSSPGFALMGKGGFSLADQQVKNWPNTEFFFDKSYLINKIVVTINDNDNSDKYLRIRYITASQSFSPKNNFDDGYSCGFLPRIEAIERPDGFLSAKSSRVLREMQAAWNRLGRNDLTKINQILLQIQETNHPVYWSAFPDDDTQWGIQHAMLGYITNWSSPSETINNGSFSMTIREFGFYA